MQGIMCVDDVESFDSALFQIPVSQIPILAEQGLVEVPAQRTAQTVAVVELGKQLLIASQDGDVELVRELMAKGAPFTTDWLGVSPLHLAVQNNHVSTAEVLLRAGISQEARTKVDRTPLHMAAQGGHLESVQLLLTHGADVNCQDMLRMTPLHWAVEKQNLEVIETLLRGGADPLAVSKFDKTPLSMALDMGRHDIVHILQTTDVSNILSLQPPSHELDQDTLAATESIAAELGTVGQHDAVTQQIQAEPSSPKKRTRIRFQVEPKQVNIIGSATPSSNAHTPKRSTSSLPTGAVAAEAEAAEVAAAAAGVAVGGTASSESPNVVGKSAPTSSAGDTPVNSTMQLLQAHGITMLPNDESTIVESAMESGQTVVLTEAGKMALNLTRVGGRIIGTPKRGGGVGNSGIIAGGLQKRAPILGTKSRIIKIHPSQLVALGGGRVQVPSQLLLQHSKGPNILKRVTVASNSAVRTIKSVPLNTRVQRVMITTPQQQQQLQQIQLQQTKIQQQQLQQQQLQQQQLQQQLKVQEIQMEDDEDDEVEDQPMPTDLQTIAQSLAAAQKQAAEFRKQLARKEREAERYLQQLRSMKAVTK